MTNIKNWKLGIRNYLGQLVIRTIRLIYVT